MTNEWERDEGIMPGDQRRGVTLRQLTQVNAAIERAREEGRREGRQEVLDFLQQQYLSEDAPDRGTPEAEAILAVARAAADYMGKKINDGN